MIEGAEAHVLVACGVRHPYSQPSVIILSLGQRRVEREDCVQCRTFRDCWKVLSDLVQSESCPIDTVAVTKVKVYIKHIFQYYTNITGCKTMTI